MFRPPQLPRTLEAALRDIGAAKASVRVEAIRDLVPHGLSSGRLEQTPAFDSIVAALVRALRDDAAEVRGAAAIALADLGARDALPALLVAVEDDDAHVRQMAITALGEIGDPRATERLRRALQDERAEVRFQAAIAFPRVSASPADAEAALLETTHDADAYVCHIALRMIEEIITNPRACSHGDTCGLTSSSRSDDDSRPLSEERTSRLDAEDSPFYGQLVARARTLLSHEAPLVRVASAILLARFGESEAHPVLIALANGEVRSTDTEDEAAAIELCGELHLDGARDGLERRAFGGILRRDPLAWHARVALARMGHDRAIREIVGELGAWNRDRRTLAIAAVGRARIQSARASIAAMRGDEARADQAAVEEALRALA